MVPAHLSGYGLENLLLMAILLFQKNVWHLFERRNAMGKNHLPECKT